MNLGKQRKEKLPLQSYFLKKKQMIKIVSPRLVNHPNEDIDLLQVLEKKNQEIAEASFKNIVVENIKQDRFSVYGCIFSGCNFIKSTFNKAQFTDVVFNHCDLSNIHFSGSSFNRVEFNGCKLMGTNLSD